MDSDDEKYFMDEDSGNDSYEEDFEDLDIDDDNDEIIEKKSDNCDEYYFESLSPDQVVQHMEFSIKDIMEVMPQVSTVWKYKVFPISQILRT